MKKKLGNQVLTARAFGMLAIAAVLSFGMQSVLDAQGDDATLTIGSKAPAIDIEHWVSDGKGEFKHIEKFEDGKVYVVEFWATWCGPCIAAMPHISELQTKHAKQGLQIISISDEELPIVEKFLKRNMGKGDNGQTFGDLTSNYCLTTDPDRSVSKDYMEAAAQNGIPTAFIVGKKGMIEWIGHPMEIDEPIEKVLTDKWDRAGFAADFKAVQEFEIVMQKVGAKFQSRDMDGANEILESFIKKTKSEKAKLQAKVMRLQVLVMGENEKAGAAVADYAKTTDDGEQLNNIAWNIFQMSKQKKIDAAVLAGAYACAEKAVKVSPSAGYIWDTLAHMQAEKGEIDKAIASQTKAIENTKGADKIELQEYLAELKKKQADEKDK